MTDNEIIKALECCSKENKCQECPYGAARLDDKYVSILSKDALDLINRQKAEIENLRHNIKCEKDHKEALIEQSKRQKAEIEKLSVELKSMRGAANSYRAEVNKLQKRIITNLNLKGRE